MNASILALALLACRDDRSRRRPEPTDAASPVDSGASSGTRPLCAERTSPAPVAPELAAWADAIEAGDNRYYGQAEWRALEALGEDLGATPDERFANLVTRGWSRLKFGDLEGAVADLEHAEAEAVALGNSHYRGRARELLGIAWMRIAETTNCFDGGSSSCIVPFDDAAVHEDKSGMRHAADAFLRALEEDLPDRSSLRWLYNVTFMARGTWPEDVPAAWVLPESFLAAEGPADAFVNHAPGLEVDRQTLAGGSALEDVDGDGLVDILASAMDTQVGMDLFLAVGDGEYCRASEAAGLTNQIGVLDFKVADYDNDGDPDIAAPRAGWQSSWGGVRMSLLRNDGAGHFEDVTEAAGLADAVGPSQVAVWADFDADGLLDLFVGREDDDTTATSRWRSSLYNNDGDGTFTDRGSVAGVAASGFVKGASAFDYDDDGDQDLYVSSLKGSDHLWENDGTGTFVDRARELGVLEPVRSFASAAFDYDQDGREDLFVSAFTTNYAGGGPMDPGAFQSAESFADDRLGDPLDPAYSETAHLYRNTGAGFEDVTVAVGLDDIHATMGFTFGDYEMDGWPDLFYSTGGPEYDALEPNTTYRNDGGARFLDTTAATRMGHLQKGHGPSFGDLDEDGDEDVFVELGGAFPGDAAPNALFVNPANDRVVRRHGVTLRLEGVTVNRDARGARVAIVTPGRTFHHTVGATGSFGGNSLAVEAGLGDEETIDRVEIRWPAGPTEVIEDVPVDHVVRIREGEGVTAASPWRGLTIAGGDGHPHGE